MNANDREHFRQILHRLGEQATSMSEGLVAEALQTTADDTRGNLSKAPMHLGDLSSLQYEQEVSAELLNVQRDNLGEIAAALDRLEQGTYGACEDCGKEIGRDRLEAVPYTRLCIRCAEADVQKDY